MTKFYVTYHEVMCHDTTICHAIKGMVPKFGSFEVFRSARYLMLATEFLNRNISLSAHIDMAFMTYRYINYHGNPNSKCMPPPPPPPMTMNDEFTSVVALWSLQLCHNNLKVTKVYVSYSLIPAFNCMKTRFM